MRQALTIILLTLSSLAQGQVTNFAELWHSQEYRGDRLFSQGLYESAIKSYMKEIEQNKVNASATAKIAESYKILGNYDASRRYYDMLANTGQLESARHFENYADVLLTSSNSTKALEFYKKALIEDPDNKIIKDKVLGITMNEKFNRNAQYIIINPVSFNSAASDFAMRPYKDKYCFTSSDVSELIVHHNYLRDLENLSNVFLVDYDSGQVNDPMVLELDDYRLKNDGPLSLSGDLMAISRNQNHKSRKKNTLGIYFYKEDENGKLDYESEFIFNNSNYSLTHPVFNSTGDTLFFASDMPGGFGGMDIYYSTLVGTIWLAPVNVGELVNTSKNEIYPFIDEGVLYFSSDGHPGLGGIDTYKLIEEDGNKQISNLGYPLNTSWDDFSIYIDGDHGFIASNKPGGQGSDDIYEFHLLPIPRIIKPVEFNLILTDESNSAPIINAQVKIIQDIDTTHYTSSQDGIIIDSLMPGDYLVEVKKHSYEDYSFQVSLEERMNIEKKIELSSSVVTHIVSPDSILFKYGKYLLLDTAPTSELDDIVQTLNEYPEFILEISAHTDSRGKSEYNQWLSEKRAASAANYILSTGIDGSRIIQKGYGETRLLNNCRDGVRCSAEFHAVNRRIEFDFKRVDVDK
jgi:outer membrane protein OmpA-like peptidoglycan-associated protein/tetratricopeptide (TPR) repeat protein